MRNVVSVSDIPVYLHNWLREEARRRSREEGKRIGMTTLFVEALLKYKEGVESKRVDLERVMENPTGFPASVSRAFLEWGGLSVKSRYRAFIPADQERLDPKDRTYFAVHFPGYGETQAYMSQGRLKIKDKNIWREIVTKLGIRADDMFVVKIVKPCLWSRSSNHLCVMKLANNR